MPYDEGSEKLSEKVRDLMRARRSLREELEAIDWYDERIAATQDDSLKRILSHNRDEEKEHVAMLVEWLREHDKELDEAFKEHD